MKNLRKKITALLLILCLALGLAAPALDGCFFSAESISFKKSSIQIIYGETADLSDIIEIKNQTDGVYTLSASPAGVLQISGSSVKAVGAGTATVTATLTSGKKATLSVNARYAEVTEIELFESGLLYQNLASSESVTFTAFLGEGTDPSQKISWYTDGVFKYSAAAHSGGSFTLPKRTSPGSCVVKAELSSDPSLFAEKTVRVYAPFDLPVLVYQGEEIYESPDQTISFGFSGKQTTGNPEYLFEMYVGGELKESVHSFSPVFTFTPESAGIYFFEFRVNGSPVLTDKGEQGLTVCFKGVITPYGLSLDYDDGYPSVYLRWSNREDTYFTVSLSQGGTRLPDIADVYARVGFCDIGGVIDITKDYQITVKSQTFGEIYLGGGTAVLSHAAVPKAAVKYLTKKYLSSNYFMSSEAEVLELFDFMLIFRPDAVKRDTYFSSRCEVYLGYDTARDAQYFLSRFRSRLTITGNYWTSAEINGKILTVTVNYYSADAPTNFSTAGKLSHRVFVPPVTSQTGYSGALPVESFASSASASYNSNQLYYTLEQGLRPVFTADSASSAAESLFSDAKNVLRKITDNGMTEVETARAIFDYVMFSVSYDDQVVNDSTIDYAVLQPAFYPEGVLKTGFAVCDGISKTFSLLCNMMGIRCVRIVGTAGSGGGGVNHAWNKVLIGGEWYIADATWGIGKNNIDGVVYKAGSHEYFLLSDADVSKTHAEINMGYPKTAQIGYGWYVKNDKYVYHTDTAGVNAQIEALATLIYEGRNKKNYTVMGQSYTATFATFEFKAAPTLINAFRLDSEKSDFLTAALLRKGLSSGSFEFWISGNTVIVGVR